MSLFVFPGSFDPVTRGHLDLVDRALRLADRLLIAIAVHPDKPGFFSAEQRLEFWSAALGSRAPKVDLVIWKGLMVDLVREKKATAVVRGLRDSVDLVWEQRLHEANTHLYSEFETIWIPSHSDYRWISSSLVRELLSRNKSVEQLVPPEILPLLKEESSHREGSLC